VRDSIPFVVVCRFRAPLQTMIREPASVDQQSVQPPLCVWSCKPLAISSSMHTRVSAALRLLLLFAILVMVMTNS
jgi:hypothetical protein